MAADTSARRFAAATSRKARANFNDYRSWRPSNEYKQLGDYADRCRVVLQRDIGE